MSQSQDKTAIHLTYKMNLMFKTFHVVLVNIFLLLSLQTSRSPLLPATGTL